MIIDASESQAETIISAMYTVATADGTEPLSAMDRRGIEAAWSVVFGRADGEELRRAKPSGRSGGSRGTRAHGAPVDELRTTTPADIAAAIDDPSARLDTVRLMAVMAFVDAVVDDAKLDVVLATAGALGVHSDFVVAIEHLVADEVHWAGVDMLRHNVDSIPGMAWVPDDPMSAFLPFRDGHEDPALADRYRALEHQPADSLGRAFFDHYTANRFAFPGETWGVGEAWGTPHDCLHILSGYSTSAQGELLVAAFNGASLSMPHADMMESHVLPVIFTYHMGIELNKGINKGDRERMDKDPSWRDNFEGNVHLGLDPAKLWVSWSRGAAMSEDLFSGHWNFWDHVGESVDELRENYSISPLHPADAALDDAQIDRDLFARPGMPLPELSTVGVAERPTG